MHASIIKGVDVIGSNHFCSSLQAYRGYKFFNYRFCFVSKRKLKIKWEALGMNQYNRFSLDRLSKVFSTTEFHCSYNQICSEDNKQLQFWSYTLVIRSIYEKPIVLSCVRWNNPKANCMFLIKYLFKGS